MVYNDHPLRKIAGCNLGKYSALKGVLEKASPTDLAWQDKVNEVRATLPKEDLAALGKGFDEVYLEKKRLQEQLSDINVREAAYEQQLTDAMETAGLTQFRLTNGVLLGISDDPSCSVVDKDAWIGYIHKEGMEDLLSVNYMTMNSMVKGMLLNGKPLPPGLKAYMKTGIRRTPPRS